MVGGPQTCCWCQKWRLCPLTFPTWLAAHSHPIPFLGAQGLGCYGDTDPLLQPPESFSVTPPSDLPNPQDLSKAIQRCPAPHSPLCPHPVLRSHSQAAEIPSLLLKSGRHPGIMVAPWLPHSLWRPLGKPLPPRASVSLCVRGGAELGLNSGGWADGTVECSGQRLIASLQPLTSASLQPAQFLTCGIHSRRVQVTALGALPGGGGPGKG